MAPTTTEENNNITEGEKPQMNWINEEYFKETLETEFGKNYKIKRLEPIAAFGGGENYASEMLRVEIDLQLDDKSIEKTSYLLKSLPNINFGGGMVAKLELFPKEMEMYKSIIPKLENFFKEHGRNVVFGPKCWKIASEPKSILMEDLKNKNFVNVKRQDGLNMEHTKCTLRKLSEFHAVSACLYQNINSIPELFLQGIYSEKVKEIFEKFNESIAPVYVDCMMKWPSGLKYVDKIKNIQNTIIERFIENDKIDPDEFNVLNHGDLWCNNIMFQYNNDGTIKETYFVDYQISKYGSPAQDLYYFIISSVQLDLKLNNFDYFIKYYYDNLIENLKFLKYSKELPTLKKLHISLLKYGFWGIGTATGVMTAVLLDPTENASIDNMLENTEEANDLKLQIYLNKRYIDAMEDLLPWLDNRGLLE